MKKRYLISSLLLLLCSCGGNESSSNMMSNNSNNVSNSSLSSSTSSSNSSSVSEDIGTNHKEILDVLNRELECVLNEDQTGYIVMKYKGYDPYIKLPDTFYGLYSSKKEVNGKEYDVYTGEKKFDENVLELPIVGIMNGAFHSSGGVKDIYIPDSYEYFESDAFVGCTTIENYFVSDNHKSYKSVDGVLYSKDGLSLFSYPYGRRNVYNVVDGTKNILSGAFKSSTVKEVILPESIENIESYAFYMAKQLVKINIPSKITEIKEFTFNTCASLREVDFSEGLEVVGEYAFQHCQLLNTFTFPSSLRELKTSSFEQITSIEHLVLNEGLEIIGDFAFAYNEYIEEITFPSTLKTIGKYAFMQNYRLKELKLVEGIQELQEGSFFYNTALTKVNIPASLHTIGFKSFSMSENGVKEYVVSENSNYFTTVDGIVYSKDLKELLLAPITCNFTNGHYQVLDGVEKIGSHAFYNNDSLKSITLPSSLKFIGKAPFYITNLNKINYSGDIEDFKKIEAEDEIFTSSTSNDTLIVKWYQTNDYAMVSIVTCNDGTYSFI